MGWFGGGDRGVCLTTDKEAVLPCWRTASLDREELFSFATLSSRIILSVFNAHMWARFDIIRAK